MKQAYHSPVTEVLALSMVQMLCLSLTGSTEPVSTTDLDNPVIDDPLDW